MNSTTCVERLRILVLGEELAKWHVQQAAKALGAPVVLGGPDSSCAEGSYPESNTTYIWVDAIEDAAQISAMLHENEATSPYRLIVIEADKLDEHAVSLLPADRRIVVLDQYGEAQSRLAAVGVETLSANGSGKLRYRFEAVHPSQLSEILKPLWQSVRQAASMRELIQSARCGEPLSQELVDEIVTRVQLETALEVARAEANHATHELECLKTALNEHAIAAVTDRRGRILEVNDHFCTISQYTREELIGQDHRLINSGHHPKEFFRNMWRTIARGEVWRNEVKNRRKDGTFYWVDTTIVPLKDANGRINRYLTIRTNITERKEAEAALQATNQDLEKRIQERTAALRENEQRLATTLNSIGDGVIVTDIEGRITAMNPSAEALTGWSERDALGRDAQHVLRLFYERTGEPATVSIAEVLQSNTPLQCTDTLALITRDNATRSIDQICSPLRDSSGCVSGVVMVIRDTTEKRRAQEALRISQERYELASRGTNDGLWDWDLRRQVVHYSHRWRSMLGYGDSSLDATPEYWFSLVHDQDQESLHAAIDRCIRSNAETFQHEHRVRHRDGGYRWVLCRALVVRDHSGHAVRLVGSVSDITQQKNTEACLRRASLHDSLTGLPNRVQFKARLQKCLERSRHGQGYRFAVLFVDLDRFKIVNDSLGHAAGDRLLTIIAERLQNCIRKLPGESAPTERTMIARLGGDEFTIVLEDMSSDREAIELAERLQRELSERCYFDGHEMSTTLSIGIVIGSPVYATADDLLRDADTAMYCAKAAGKARYAIFDPAMHDRARARLELENGLRNAVARNELLLHYQPIVNLENGVLTGFEALVRWNRAGVGLVSPADFIPVAEETGLITSIGTWVLREACQQLKSWQMRFDDSLSMNINLSRNQLMQEDLVDTVRKAIQSADVDARHVRLEITESALMNDIDAANNVLHNLKSLGVHLDMDDFGTGYSSLSCLHQFPLDGLKIDRAFVTNMIARVDYAAVIHAIVTLAHNLHMRVTAEGVEDANQIAQLQALECDYVQGFHIASPMDVLAAEDFLLERTSSRQAA